MKYEGENARMRECEHSIPFNSIGPINWKYLLQWYSTLYLFHLRISLPKNNFIQLEFIVVNLNRFLLKICLHFSNRFKQTDKPKTYSIIIDDSFKYLPGIYATSDEQACNSISPRRSCVKCFEAFLFTFTVLPIGTIQQCHWEFGWTGFVGLQFVRAFGR